MTEGGVYRYRVHVHVRVHAWLAAAASDFDCVQAASDFHVYL